MREPRNGPQIVEILTDTPPEWRGFQFRGRFLIGPDGDRITPDRLRGLLWRDKMELQQASYASRRRAELDRAMAGRIPKVKVIVVDLAHYRLHGTYAA
jgi:hypothetical protein